jgi:uncharacterized protein with ParB-like and HNH nuclease domain
VIPERFFMQIQSEPQTLERIFYGVSTRYAVPHYQRDYTWNQDQWAELWNDITTAFHGNKEYFLGSFVLNTENLESQGIYEIVDGQQRLTTFTMLFSVIRDLAKHYGENPSDNAYGAMGLTHQVNREKAGRAATKSSLLVVHLSEPDNYFLRLNDKDHPVFHEKIQKEGPPLLSKEERQVYKAESRLTKGKKFFTRKVLEEFLNDDQGFVRLEKFVTFCMTKLILLKIAVGSDNDAYLLFETLNDRGLDLSISDLVKNRLLLGCNSDEEKKKRVLTKWNDLISRLGKSRFLPHDYLRFYWCAFEEKCTKKELYRLIRDKLSQTDGEHLLDAWLESSEFFCEITDRSLRFPHSGLSLGSTRCSYAELNTLGYSVYIPLFLYLHRHRRSLLDKIASPSASYLFRIITVGSFSAGRPESLFERIQQAVINGDSDETVLGIFSQDPEAADDKFQERLRTQRFEENKAARHFLSKWHLHENGQGHPLNQDVQLEHVLPQKEDAWPGFDLDGRAREDWVYTLGNMTLLEQALNKSLQASEFSTKVSRYRQRDGQNPEGSALPMTYRIAVAHDTGGRVWDHAWISERTEWFAAGAAAIWPLPQSTTITPEGAGGVSALESEDGML